MNRRIRCAMLLLAAIVSVATAAGAQSTDPDPYQEARLELVRGNLDRAIVLLDAFRRAHPKEERVGEARYWESFARYRRNAGDDLRRAAALLAISDGARVHPDATALAARVRALQGGVTPLPPRCTADNGLGFAEAIAMTSSPNDTRVELIASEALSTAACPVVGRRSALALLGRSSSPRARDAVRRAAIGDDAPQVRSEALVALVADTGVESLRLVAMAVRRDTSGLVVVSAADVLSRLGHPATADTVLAVVMDSTLPLSRRQTVLSWSRFAGRKGPSTAALRRAFPELAARGALGATVLEYVAARGDAGDRDWIWGQVGDGALPTTTRLTGLQQVGRGRSVAELRALFEGSTPQLLQFGVLEQLRGHPDPKATQALVEIIDGERAGVVRGAAEAALASRVRSGT